MAIDPVAEMLTYGQAMAKAAGVQNIIWRQGDSGHLSSLVEPGAHLAVFATSFHWTNRAEVVAALDRLLHQDGRIVVINDDLSDAEQPEWEDVIAGIRSRYLGAQRRAGTGTYSSPGPAHRDVLGESAFSAVERLTWSWTRELTVDEVVGLQFSYSFSTPAQLGTQAKRFGNDVRDAVLALHLAGVVTESFRVEVLVASRL